MITLIAACSKNWVIGKDNQLIWHLPEDLKRFRKLTTNKSVLMGRKTFESIGKPLPNRKNIIITSDRNFKVDGCFVYNDLIQALQNEEDIMVIGGGQIYQQSIKLADKIELTMIDEEFEGDSFFPEIDSNWIKINFEKHQNEKFKWSYITYLRKDKSL